MKSLGDTPTSHPHTEGGNHFHRPDPYNPRGFSKICPKLALSAIRGLVGVGWYSIPTQIPSNKICTKSVSHWGGVDLGIPSPTQILSAKTYCDIYLFIYSN